MTDEHPDIQNAKLELEKQKLVLDDKWRKRTYIWTILSALLTALVAITVPLLSGGGEKERLTSLSAGPIGNCLNSLKRVETLSRLPDQTLQHLANAVDIHVGNCEGILDTLIEELK